MPYGRGGAGNLQAIEQQNAKASADLEANQAAAESDHKGPLPSDYLDKEEQRYAHSGRGGAGNYYSPKELSETGHFSDAHRSHILGDGTQPPASSAGVGTGSEPPSYNTAQSSSAPNKSWGRGGVGNMTFGMADDEVRAAERRMQQEKIKEKLKADVEKGVKESLAMPQKAKLPGGEPY